MGWNDELAYSVSERAYLLHTEGRYQEALVLFQALSELDPENLYYLDAVAALHLALKRPESAIQSSSALLQKDASHIRALVRRCEAYASLHMFREAEADAQQLRRLGAHEDAQRAAMRLAAVRDIAVSARQTS